MDIVDVMVLIIFISTVSVIIINFFLVLFAREASNLNQTKSQRLILSPAANLPEYKPQKPMAKDSCNAKVELDEYKDQKLVEEALAIMKSNHHNSYLTVERLADQLGTSKRNLQRKFKIVKNTSPSKELKRVRIENALDRLNKGERIKQAGFNAGFSSQSYFCKCFKDTIGVTPSDFIKRDLNI